MRAGGNETPGIETINLKTLTHEPLTLEEEALRQQLAEEATAASLKNAQASIMGGLSRHGQVLLGS